MAQKLEKAVFAMEIKKELKPLMIVIYTPK